MTPLPLSSQRLHTSASGAHADTVQFVAQLFVLAREQTLHVEVPVQPVQLLQPALLQVRVP